MIRWYVDNRLFLTVTPARLPAGTSWVFNNRPFFLIVNLAVGGRFPGNPDATSVFPQRVEVDYMRVYARTTAPAATVRIQVGERGMFFYSEGPENDKGYTIWFDEVQFE